MRYFLEIAYYGANYSGWQIQPNRNTIQLELNKALSTALSNDISCVGCGRTDAGVHAKQYFLHFDTAKPITKNFIYKIKRLLPKDIAVKEAIVVDPSAHCRFDASRRTYAYYIHFEKDPFLQDFSYYYPYSWPDLVRMNQAAERMLQFNDFQVLCKVGGGAKTTICNLTESAWAYNKSNGQMVFTVSSDRFLRGMVRMMVGVLLMIGSDKLSMGELSKAMKSKQRLKYILPVPSQGLFLTSVKYPFI